MCDFVTVMFAPFRYRALRTEFGSLPIITTRSKVMLLEFRKAPVPSFTLWM